MEASLKGRLPLHTQLSKNGITKHITKENMHGGTEEQGEEGMEVQKSKGKREWGFKGSGQFP